MTPHMSLPISTTTNCELFKTLTLYNDNTCIAANGYIDQLMDRQLLMLVPIIYRQF